MTELIELLEVKGERRRFLSVAGGLRIANKLAVEVGYDVGFGRGAYDVATFIVRRVVERARGT